MRVIKSLICSYFPILKVQPLLPSIFELYRPPMAFNDCRNGSVSPKTAISAPYWKSCRGVDGNLSVAVEIVRDEVAIVRGEAGMVRGEVGMVAENKGPEVRGENVGRGTMIDGLEGGAGMVA